MTPVRIKFEKTGVAKYISHLDLNRCMSRALRRAQIPVWYTQGFNPHPYITFALPLSLGFESKYEIMDLKLDADMDFAEIKDRLSAQMPQGLSILGVQSPVMKVADIAYAEYLVVLSAEDPASCYDAESLLKLENITVLKKTKSGSRDINIKEYLQNSEIVSENNQIEIKTILPASSTENINPGCFSEAFQKYQNIISDIQKITRLFIYNKNRELFI